MISSHFTKQDYEVAYRDRATWLILFGLIETMMLKYSHEDKPISSVWINAVSDKSFKNIVTENIEYWANVLRQNNG